MADVSYRLTFNKPAGRQFLEGHTGVAITFDRKSVYFRPVKKARGDNCVTLVPRGERGGYEATIDGAEAKTLLRAMMRDATPTHPFFLLLKSPDDPQVLVLSHYAKDDAPPKIEPHVRLWPPQPKAKERRAAEQQTAAPKKREGVFGVLDDVRKAHAVILDHAENRRIGRPTRELEAAKTIMAEFESVVRDIRPSPLDGIELTPEQRGVVAQVMRDIASAMATHTPTVAQAAAASPAQGAVAMMAGASPEVAPPRRRGRPPKVVTQDAVQAAPRRRGRPPKAAAQEAALETPRRRGRPPKAAAQEAAPETPRRRGRPPKKAAVQETAPETPRRRGRPKKAASPSVATGVPKRRKPGRPAGRATAPRRAAAPEPQLPLPQPQPQVEPTSRAAPVADSLPPAPMLTAPAAISASYPVEDDDRRVVPDGDDDLTPDQRDLILNTKALAKLGRGKAGRPA